MVHHIASVSVQRSRRHPAHAGPARASEPTAVEWGGSGRTGTYSRRQRQAAEWRAGGAGTCLAERQERGANMGQRSCAASGERKGGQDTPALQARTHSCTPMPSLLMANCSSTHCTNASDVPGTHLVERLVAAVKIEWLRGITIVIPRSGGGKRGQGGRRRHDIVADRRDPPAVHKRSVGRAPDSESAG